MNSQNDSCWNLLRFVCEPAFLARSQKAWHRGWTPMQQIGLVLSVCDLSYLYTHSILNLLGLKKKKTLICFWALKNKSSYFVWNFQGTLWNSTQNILPKHWKLWFLYNTEILRALRLKNAYAIFETHSSSSSMNRHPVSWMGHRGHTEKSHFMDKYGHCSDQNSWNQTGLSTNQLFSLKVRKLGNEVGCLCSKLD